MAEFHQMPVDLLATCWTHAGDAVPVAGRNLSPLDLRERAEAVAAAGFTGIGFTIDDLEAAGATYSLHQVRRICEDLGLVHLEVELLEEWWTTGGRRRRSDQARTSLLTAAEVLGVRQIKIGPDVEVVNGAVPPLSDVGHWAAELHQLAVQATEVGTRVALEPLPFSDITDFRVAAGLVATADHPAAGLVVDIWHVERGPSTLADLAQIPGDKVFVVELNDAPAPLSTDLFHDTIHNRVLCGAGTFDVTGFIETLQRIGFDGPWGVEIISDAHRRRPCRRRWWTRITRRWQCSTACPALRNRHVPDRASCLIHGVSVHSRSDVPIAPIATPREVPGRSDDGSPACSKARVRPSTALASTFRPRQGVPGHAGAAGRIGEALRHPVRPGRLTGPCRRDGEIS